MLRLPEIFPDLILVTRMKRSDERKWQDAKSWLGGLPAIDSKLWPRSTKTGIPLHHLAHINLAEVPRGKNTPSLPDHGSLSFFVDTSLDSYPLDVAVVYSEEGSDIDAIDPPSDCPPLGGNAWTSNCRGVATAAEAPRSYRRWPIEFLPAFASGQTYPDLSDIVSSIGRKPESIHIFNHTRLAHVSSALFPWEILRRMVEDFKHTIHVHERSRAHQRWTNMSPEEHEKRWLRKNHDMNLVRHFIAVWSEELATRDPFEPIGQTVSDSFEMDLWAMSRRGFRCRYGYAPTRDAASDVYRDMMVDTRETFERIPVQIRDYLLNERRLSGWDSSWFHQMFGIAPRVQEADFEDEVLLFSARSDDMMSWLWGDVGLINFLISPDALAARQWHKTRGVFQGH